MNIEIKKSKKPVKYEDALILMEKRLLDINQNNNKDLVWVLEHDSVYTAGTSFDKNDVIDNSINITKTNEIPDVCCYSLSLSDTNSISSPSDALALNCKRASSSPICIGSIVVISLLVLVDRVANLWTFPANP